MLQHITRKISYSYRQLVTFIDEENLKIEAIFSLAVFLFLIIILYG